MGKEIRFTLLDLATWKRRELFYYFSKMAPTGYSLTVDLDITEMLHTLKSADIKFFPAYLWLVTKTLNFQTEFKIAQKDGQLGYYDTLTAVLITIKTAIFLFKIGFVEDKLKLLFLSSWWYQGGIAMSFYIYSMPPNSYLSKKSHSCLRDIATIRRNTLIIINALSHYIA